MKKKSIKEEMDAYEAPKEALVNRPSMVFCEKCKSKELRVIKENMNMAVLALFRVASEMNLLEESLEATCKRMLQWVRKQESTRNAIAEKGHKRNKKERNNGNV